MSELRELLVSGKEADSMGLLKIRPNTPIFHDKSLPVGPPKLRIYMAQKVQGKIVVKRSDAGMYLAERKRDVYDQLTFGYSPRYVFVRFTRYGDWNMMDMGDEKDPREVKSHE